MVPKPYLGLDIIRLAAACMVMLYHLAFEWWLPDRSQIKGPFFSSGLAAFRDAASSGWVGVQIFFVLSGFVIAFSANGKNAQKFILNRARRLYPSIWICATLTLPFVHGPDLAMSYIRTMALSPLGPWISGVYWTLAIESVFYILVALVLTLWGSPAIVKLGITLGLYSSTFWFLHLANPLIGSLMQPLFSAVESRPGYLLLMHHGCYFGLGIILWRGNSLGWNTRFIVLAAMFAGAGALGVAGTARAIAPTLAIGADMPNAVVAPLIWLTALVAIVASIIWNSRVYRILGSYAKEIRFLGLLTYPLYLVHEDMGRAVMVAVHSIGAVGALSTGVAAVVAVSIIVTLAEKRLQAFMGKKFGAQTPAAQLP